MRQDLNQGGWPILSLFRFLEALPREGPPLLSDQVLLIIYAQTLTEKLAPNDQFQLPPRILKPGSHHYCDHTLRSLGQSRLKQLVKEQSDPGPYDLFVEKGPSTNI